MTGQRERITHRVVVRVGRTDSFLPPHGIGYGLGDGLGIVLNRTVKGPPKYSAIQRTITGKVIEESPECVILELRGGHKLKIRIIDIVRRESALFVR